MVSALLDAGIRRTIRLELVVMKKEPPKAASKQTQTEHDTTSYAAAVGSELPPLSS